MVTLQTIVVMILIMSRPQLAEYHNNTFTIGSGIVQTTYKANLEGKDVANNTTVPYIGRSSIETTTEASDQSKQDYLKHIYETVEYVQDIYVLPFVCTIGIIGNGIVAYFLFARRRSSSSFIYMLAIFVTDILSLVSDLFLPFSTLLKESDSLAVREVAVYLYNWNKVFITYVLRITSFNIFCVLSAERLMAIQFPLKLKSSLTVKRPQIFLLLSLISGTGLTIPRMIYTKITENVNPSTNETIFKRVYSDLYLSNEELNNRILIILHFFAGPVQIVFFCVMNVLIVHGIFKSKKMLLNMNANNNVRIKTIKNLQVKLCKIFMVLCFTNVLAFLPNSVATITIKLSPGLGLSLRDYLTQLILHGGNFLRILNSASDFIVMLVMSKEIRRDLKHKMFHLGTSEDKYQSSRTLNSDLQSISGNI